VKNYNNKTKEKKKQTPHLEQLKNDLLKEAKDLKKEFFLNREKYINNLTTYFEPKITELFGKTNHFGNSTKISRFSF